MANIKSLAEQHHRAKKSSNLRYTPDQPTQHDNDILSLMSILNSIELDTAVAKLNESTISNNNGGRIFI